MAGITDYKKELLELLQTVIKEGGSDLHISAARHPTIRVSGQLIPLVNRPLLSLAEASGLVNEMLTPENKTLFVQDKEVDFSFTYDEQSRFRGNAYIQRGSPSAALRLIPKHIKTVAELNLPPILETFTKKKQGFFLVVGPVGQGKTTTLAAMIEHINQERLEHIITIEDPIEYLFENKKAIIDQREIRLDARSFHRALLATFREDVDVIMVGEMRGLDTIATAVTAAETGHLVLSTLHTNSAAQTIERIIDSFPATQQSQIRLQLSNSLMGIFSQRLVPRISGGLIPACELLINNNAVSNLIREERVHEINTVIETSSGQGMIDMNRSLVDLVRRGEISIENAYLYSINPKTLEKLL
jgi:twitching motility protein PilT